MNDTLAGASYTLATATWRGRALRAVLFDLDGTLLDTAADIARALNRVHSERGWAALPVSDVSRMIGRGSPILIERAAAALIECPSAADQAHMVERFFEHYGSLEESNESDAEAYAGVAETLEVLHRVGMPLAVVTNKQHRFAQALLERLNLKRFVSVLVGGDTCERRKPDPQPLLFACQSLGVSPSEALMVGDSINDVTAARAAHIPVVCVPYGYNEGQDSRSLKCDALIATLAELPALLWPKGAA
jgi:phosphoglycolate phosphatase